MNFPQLNTQFKEIAAPYYSDLLYHNLKHAQEVQKNAHRIAQLLNMTEFEQIAVCRAAWMHDAGYHLPLDKSLYATKEDLSIALMKQESELLFTKQYQWIKQPSIFIFQYSIHKFIRNPKSSITRSGSYIIISCCFF